MQVWLVAADCLLLGSQPVLIHLSKSAAKQYFYHPLSVNVVTELAKTGFAAALLLTFVRPFPNLCLPDLLAF